MYARCNYSRANKSNDISSGSIQLMFLFVFYLRYHYIHTRFVLCVLEVSCWSNWTTVFERTRVIQMLSTSIDCRAKLNGTVASWIESNGQLHSITLVIGHIRSGMRHFFFCIFVATRKKNRPLLLRLHFWSLWSKKREHRRHRYTSSKEFLHRFLTVCFGNEQKSLTTLTQPPKNEIHICFAVHFGLALDFFTSQIMWMRENTPTSKTYLCFWGHFPNSAG